MYQTPIHYIVRSLNTHFTSSQISLIKSLSIHIVKHSVSQAFLGVQAFEMTRRKKEILTTSTTTVADAMNFAPWENQFKLHYSFLHDREK